MTKRLVIIQGRSDPQGEYFCHAPTEGYAVERIDIAKISHLWQNR